MGKESITLTPSSHIRLRSSMWGASNAFSMYKCIDENGDIYESKTKHSNLIMKMVDELLVNSIDQSKNKRNKVDTINVIVNIKKNYIAVRNNGKPMKINKRKIFKYNVKTKKESGYDVRKLQDVCENRIDRKFVYEPEVNCLVPMSGTNFEKDKEDTSVKGGINGVGVKLVSHLSKKMLIDISNNGTRYRQRIINGALQIDDPIIEDTDKENYTQIAFFPKTQLHEEILDVIRYRINMSALYCSAKILLNKVESKITDPKEFLDKINFQVTNDMSDKRKKDITRYEFKVTSSNEKAFKWNIIIDLDEKRQDSEINCIVNGLVTNSGHHVDYLFKHIANHIKGKIKDKTIYVNQLKKICNICMHLESDFVDWSAQNKSKMIETEKMTKVLTKDMKGLKGLCIKNIAEHIMSLVYYDKKKKSKKIELSNEQYTFSISNKGKGLFLTEGLSASKFVETGLKRKGGVKSDVTFQHYGVFSLMGVILNTLKLEEQIEASKNIAANLKKRDKINNNKTLTALKQILKLEYDVVYTKENIKSLRYKSVIICTDQDLDGIGKIANLVLVYYYTYWPSLFDIGYIKIFETPIVKVFKNEKIIKYIYNISEVDSIDTKGVTLRYYKGLAAHETKVEIPLLFKGLKEHLNTFTITDIEKTKETFYKFHGSDSSGRKEILTSEVEYKKKETNDHTIDVIDQFYTNGKNYKLSRLYKQIPGILDGLTEGRRKIVFTIKNSPNKSLKKIYMLSTDVVVKTHYVHGPDSLNKTITTMAGDSAIGMNYPYLIPKGTVGNRKSGRGGSPRYVSVKGYHRFINAMFSKEDDPLLPYNYEEGTRIEPTFYIPIIPMGVLESMKFISEGWAHKSYARNYNKTIIFVKKLIHDKKDKYHKLCENIYNKLSKNGQFKDNDEYDELRKTLYDIFGKGHIPIDNTKYLSKIQSIESDSKNGFIRYVSQGIFKIKSKTSLHISEIPMGMTSISYIRSLNKEKLNISRINDCSSDAIDIQITFRTGTDLYEEKEILQRFKLVRKMGDNLVYYSDKNRVVDIGSNYYYGYMIVIMYWFHLRKQLYKKRIERTLSVLKIKLKYNQCILKYLQSNLPALHAKNKYTEDKFNNILDNDYKNIHRLNKGLYLKINSLFYNELPNIFNGNKLTYGYLLDLTDRKKTKSQMDNLALIISELKKQIKIYMEKVKHKFPGKEIWLNEIDTITKLVEDKRKVGKNYFE